MLLHNTLIVFVDELRKTVKYLALGIGILTFCAFFLSSEFLELIQTHLANRLNSPDYSAQKLYFFTVAGPFLAHVKLAVFLALYVLMPWVMTILWRALGKPFKVTKNQLIGFIFFTSLLFYGGTLFCYGITLPYGIEFLLGFGSEQLKPVISIGRFVNFTTLFIFAFGVIFELPIFMVFTAKVGICTRNFYERNRRYALLIIAIIAALLTPTPDIFNMMLMAGPLYLLYEAGILIIMAMKIK